MNTVITNPLEQIVKKPSLGDTYGFVSTRDVLNVFENKGWKVVNEQIMGTRNPERQGYQKHLLRMEHADFPRIPGLTEANTSRVQLCLLNSHDGTSSFRVFLGLIRMACLNGMISGTSLKDFRAYHSKNVLSRLADGIEQVAGNIPELFKNVAHLQSKQLSLPALTELTKTMVDMRLRNVRKIVAVDYASATHAIRDEDMHDDAFTAVNRLQEKIIRGGIAYAYERNVKDDNGNVIGSRLTHTTTRRLSSIAGQISLNRALFDKAMEVAS